MSDQGFGTPGNEGPTDPARPPDFGGQPAFGQPDFGGQPAYGGDPEYSPPPPPSGPPPQQYPQQPPYVPPQPTQQMPPVGNEPPPPYGQPQYGQPPPYGQPQYGDQPKYGQQPPYGQPQYGQQPPYGQPQYGDQPQYAQPPPYGQPPDYGQQPPYGPAGGYPAGAGGGGGHKAQWIAVLVAILAAAGVGAYFLFSGSSASASTPKEALTKLFEAGKTSDVEAAKKVLCAADIRAGLVDQLQAGGRVTAYTIGKVTNVDSDHATVSATVTTTLTKSPFPQTVPVVKEGGKWKVCYPASGVASTPTALPSSPSTEVPSVIPSITSIPSLPAGAVNPCQYASSASTAATIYVGLAEIGQDATAQACVYQNSVPASVTASLHASGTSLYAPNGSSTGPTFEFNSVDGKSKVEVTVTKQSDGKYWVTKVEKS
jgi:hypothetical protein